MRWSRLRRLRRVQSNGIEKRVVVCSERWLGKPRRVVAERERERAFLLYTLFIIVKVMVLPHTELRARVWRVYNVIIIIIIIKKVKVQTGATAPAWRLTDLFA